MSEEDRKLIASAIKNIESRKKITARFVRGGATGLVQQRGIRSYRPSQTKTGIIKSIKDSIKNNDGISLVLIQRGYYIEVIEEDARYFHKEFGLKIHDSGGNRPYEIAGFPKSALNKYTQILLEKGLDFCTVEQVDKIHGVVVREITFSAQKKECIGRRF